MWRTVSCAVRLTNSLVRPSILTRSSGVSDGLFCRLQTNHISMSSYLSQKEPRSKKPQKKRSNEPRLKNLSYEELSSLRRDQASRSVLIQVPGRQSCHFLHKLCLSHGRVSKMFYESGSKDYVLVEFESEQSALSLCSSADHFETENVPVETRVLYLVNSHDSRESVSSLPIVNEGAREVNFSDLHNASTMSEQVLMYYHAERLTELETRLRYFVCSLLEDVLTPLFPLVEIFPYGSSANRLGRHGSDLDMVLKFNNARHKIRRHSPLKYMTKIVDDDRHFTQRTLRVIADILHLFVPHITQVQKIVHARVPIINFYHEATNTSCDISVSNDSVLTMSKFLYLLGESDQRFRPLIFALRRWAHINDLTLDRPGPRFSNFMLTLMALAYLQMRPDPLLAPLSSYLSEHDQTYHCRDTVQLTDHHTQSDQLIIDFFNFYADFDFSNNGISLYRGSVIEKPASCPLYIENPLDHGHNCAQNVHQKELEYLQVCIRSARERLVNHREKSDKSWGLLNLVESRNFGSDVNVGVNVRHLFTS